MVVVDFAVRHRERWLRESFMRYLVALLLTSVAVLHAAEDADPKSSSSPLPNFVSHVGDHVKHDWWHGREETHEEDYVTDLINRYAVDFIERHKEQPFCLYVPHLSIHNPVQMRGDEVRRSEAEGWTRWRPANEEERIAKYRGMVLPIDEGVGLIRETLVRLGLDRNTLVLFFSDNGASSDFPSGSSHYRGNKGSVYEGGHKVPFIACWPGRIRSGTQNAAPTITLDVMPTLLSLAGVASPRIERWTVWICRRFCWMADRLLHARCIGLRSATTVLATKRCVTASGNLSSITRRQILAASTMNWSSFIALTRTHRKRPI